MPSEDFYLGIGIAALLFLMFGGVFAFGPQNDPNYAPPILMMIGPFVFGLGAILVLVLLAGILIDLRTRYREWDIERREKESQLYKREARIQKHPYTYIPRKPSKLLEIIAVMGSIASIIGLLLIFLQ